MLRLCLLYLLTVLCLADDRTISQKLKARLARSKIKQNPIEYRVENGVVHWQGSVAIPQHKGAATRMAKAAGATRVDNRIQVSEQAKAKNGPAPRPVTVQLPRR